MKAITLSAMLFLSAATLFGQSPKKVSTTTKSTSVSVSNSDNGYALLAYFDNTDAEKLKTIIAEVLGAGTKTGQSEMLWKLKDVYTLTLNSEKLSIELDKDKASATLYRSFVKLGDDIQQEINHGHSAPATPKTPAN